MNIVFWLLITIGLILAWFCLSFVFKGVGTIGLKLYNDAKDEIIKKEENHELKENNKNEG